MAEHGRYVGDRLAEADVLADLRLELDEAIRQMQDAELELRRGHDRYVRCLEVLTAARAKVGDQQSLIRRQTPGRTLEAYEERGKQYPFDFVTRSEESR